MLWPLAMPCSSSVIAGENIMKCMTFCNTAWYRRSLRPLWEPKPPISKKIPSQSQTKPDVHYLNRVRLLKWYFKKKPKAAPMQINIIRNQWDAMGEIQTTWILPMWIDYISKTIRTSGFHHQIFLQVIWLVNGSVPLEQCLSSLV